MKPKNTTWQPESVEAAPADSERDAATSTAAVTSVQRGSTAAGSTATAGQGGAGGVGGTRAAEQPLAIDAGQPATRASDAGAPPPRDAGSATPAAPSKSRDASVSTDASTRPDAASAAQGCKPGTYAGTFSGTLEVAGVPVSTVTGAINADLPLDILGLYLNVVDLRVVGADESGNTLTVTVSGNINCTTFQLEDGLLSDGKYINVANRTELPFVGVAQGTYSTSPYALNGTWNVEAQGSSSLVGGSGEFKLTLLP